MTRVRKLAAIMFTDIVGYSSLMSTDQQRALELLHKSRSIHKSLINRFNGKWLKEMGDGVLASFSTVSDAVFCAVLIQELCNKEPELNLRIGIHQGEVIFESGDVFGDGVNIAARIEPLAPTGSVYISSAVFQNISNRKEFETEFVSEYKLKNIEYPIGIYQVCISDPKYLKDTKMGSTRVEANKKRWVRGTVYGVAISFLLALGYLWMKPPNDIPDDPTDQTPTSAEEAFNALLDLPSGPRIAVLQFKNLSNDSEQNFFVDGLAEDIITELSKTNLFVLASGTSFKFSLDSLKIDEVCQTLNVQYLLTGSAQRQENSIRVITSLIDGTTQRQVWGDSYDRNLTTADIFSLQDDITQRVVGTISDSYGIIAQIKMQSIERERPIELNAYECVLRASKFAHTHAQEDHLLARSCLEQAIKQDSTYVDALAWLAYLYREEYLHDLNQEPRALERALKLSQKAVELDKWNQQAFRSLAVVHFGLKNVEEFFIAANRAIELNPNNATVIGGLGAQIALAGEWDRGIGLLEKALILNPYSSLSNWLHFTRASNMCKKKRYQEALAEIHKVHFTSSSLSDILVIAIFEILGDSQSAQSKLKQALAQNPDFTRNAKDELERYFLKDQGLIDLFMSNLEKVSTDLKQ